MAVVGSLFIQPIIQRTQNISSPPTKVLDVQTNICMIDSILAINLSSAPIFVSVYISTGNFIIIPMTQIQPGAILQLLKESYFSVKTGESLFATSDSNQNLFNINIEGRLFTELV